MLSIQAAVSADSTALLALNESCVPHVNSIGVAELAFFLEQAMACVKCVERGTLAGFMICLAPGCAYASPNYAWFDAHYTDFAYVDRLMVAPAFRRRGVAGQLYDEITAQALELGLMRLCCEVNVEPPNPQSLQFHSQLGFVEVGRQRTEGGSKEVALLVKEL